MISDKKLIGTFLLLFFLASIPAVQKVNQESASAISTDDMELTITYPQGGEKFYLGDSITVKWESNYSSESKLNIEYLPNWEFEQPDVTINSKEATIQLPRLPSLFRIKISDSDNPQVASFSGLFKVNAEPFFYFYSPKENETLQVDSTNTIQISVNDTEYFKLEYSFDSGQNWQIIESNIYSGIDTVKVHNYKWQIPETVSRNCFLKATSLDDTSLSLVSPQFEITDKDEKDIGYFPLQIGNKWFYKYYHSLYGNDDSPEGIQSIWEIIDTTSINGNISYRVEIHGRVEHDKNIFHPIDTCYITKVNSYVKIDSIYFGDFELDYRSSAPIDTNNIFAEPLKEYLIGDYIFNFQNITDSIGVTLYNAYAWSTSYGTYLVGAILDGQAYGDTLQNYIVGVSEKDDKKLPTNYQLYQNYPNPFNPTTVISFSIPKQSNVKLSVYNFLGQEIEVLLNEIKAAGTYKVKFDASNLSSGIYIYQLKAGSLFINKKMILLK